MWKYINELNQINSDFAFICTVVMRLYGNHRFSQRPSFGQAQLI